MSDEPKQVDDSRWDNILDRFENPEEVKAQLMARRGPRDPYPEGFREICLDVYFNRFEAGNRDGAAKYCGIPTMTLRGWVNDVDRKDMQAQPFEEWFNIQAKYKVTRLKQAMMEAVDTIPSKLKKSDLGATLRYLPRIAKLIQQIEAGEMPHDLETLEGKKGPNVAKVVKDTLMPDKPETDDDADAVLAKIEARRKTAETIN